MSLSAVKYTPNTLNRNIIREDALFDGVDKKTLCLTINKVKNLLRDAGAKKHDLVTISILTVDLNHIASIFACAEMGLKIIILDSPATLESLPYTKLALHGPSDFYIYDSEENTTDTYNGLHNEMMRRYGGMPVDVRQEASDEDFHVDVFQDDSFLLSSTSGTTKPSRPVLFSHREVYQISKRNIDVFEYKDNSKVVHSRNLHHASALLTSLMPALMVVHSHGSFSISHDLSNTDDNVWMRGLYDMYKNPPSHIMIPNKAELMNFLESFPGPFDRSEHTPTGDKYISRLNINMCGFTLDQSFVELAKKYNIRFQSHYGSIDTAIPLLVNFVDEDSEVIPNSLGIIPDDFYDVRLVDGRFVVNHEFWDEPRTLEDVVEQHGDQYILKPRKENSGRYLQELLQSCPEEIDLDLFFQDTKLNYEQLRGHIQEVKKRYDQS